MMTYRSDKVRLIGIDPGTKTGVAIYNTATGHIELIDTVMIHEAFRLILNTPDIKKVRVEDARKRKWFGKDSHAKMQGAGSIKRDCSIWEDFLTDHNIPYEMVHPLRGATKLKAKMFSTMFGYAGRTSSHGRDAAMLVIGYGKTY